MDLRQLLEGVAVRKIDGKTNPEIAGVAYHSQQVDRNFLFVAIRGLEVDGHRFIGEAVRRGAVAVLMEEGVAPEGVTAVFVEDSRRALARVASNFYGDPSSRLSLVGVTGTNGKTTTTYLIESILKRAGRATGVIGTINYRYGQKTIPALNTTPESLDLQRILREMGDHGVSHVVMEVSSHGLDLDRVAGCHFDAAVFTNFTSDHLDYHQTLEHYFESKRKFFKKFLLESQKAKRFAVTNVDDPRGEEIVKEVPLPLVRYGLERPAEVSASEVTLSFEGLSCRVRTPENDFPVRSRLTGRFNLYNLLAAVATGYGLGLPAEVLKEGIEAVEGVPGRLEKVENRKGIHVIVDYAHTRDALERVLTGLRETLARSDREGKIITVFGCGGDRDRTKRPLMGEVAARLSDLVVITSDNPRTEDPLAILQEVEAGVRPHAIEALGEGGRESWRAKKGYLKIPDRRQAIRTAIDLAERGDVVLIAGKGHEDYQIVGRKRFPFDDRLEAKRALEEE
ncbi:MAG: UDP-N-acetylmuramoyl-L-alanyl-D-glutamate--2,6-diaminopimelate ligase [Desulfobacterota bacterium]|nr:UDP-N-acetylmuramoyl-L-alanyl-D-glutamate--2,6-diaminopimelate ligase [Thermodesulfobacteriota bacterium]